MGARRRTGIYEKTRDGHSAFSPYKIPALKDLDLDDELFRLISEADLSLGRLDGFSGTIPEPDLFTMMYIKKEAVLSSQIEGTQASLMDVLEYEGRSLNPSSRKDLPEVLNYIAALKYGTDRLGGGEKLDMDMVRHLHSILMKGTRGGEYSGEFRHVQNWIGSRDGTIGDAVYVPPTPKRMVSALTDLETYMVRTDEIPPLIKAALVHAWFETIHPFIDGNGRVGRLLITMILVQEGSLSRPMLYLSHYFKNKRSEYYDRLQGLRDRDEIEEWLDFFLRGIVAASADAYGKTEKIIDLKEIDKEKVMGSLGKNAAHGIKLLDDLFKRPITNVNAVKELTDLSFPSASKLISSFVEIGILEEVTGLKKNRVFEFKEYMDLLEK
jgi:Fic family protein